VEINLLATQQNAVGFTGYDTIAGHLQTGFIVFGNYSILILSVS